MTDKKYTNEDIISSLKIIATTRNCNECKIRNCKWGTCNCSQITANAALDLINRQKAEIDSAKAKIEICAEVIKRQDAEIKRLKECPKCVYEYDGETMEYCVRRKSEQKKRLPFWLCECKKVRVLENG